MRSFALSSLIVPVLLATTLPSYGETLSAEVGKTGLASVEARLTSLASPSDADRFALAGMRFLRTIEGALQLRWQTGLSEPLTMLPVLRLPIPENPTPEPFDPAAIATLFRAVSIGMEDARAALAGIPEGSDFGVEIAFDDLWFDINANTTRDEGEDLLDVAGPMILGWQWAERDPATPAPTVRFDGADAAWLSAYTHLLGGLADTVLAYDPTAPITRFADARGAMTKLGTLTPDPIFGMGGGGSLDAVDYFAIILATLNQTPDKDRMLSAQSHLLAMIADNRRFWSEVALETDNAREWLPNDAQTSALGITLPPGTGPLWLGILSDLEAVLKGETLIPYWRMNGPVGVNVSAMFSDPRPIDLAAWLQGEGALPYLQQGTLASPQNTAAFGQVMSGQAMLLSLYLN